MSRLSKYLPILTWSRSYDSATLSADLLAAVIVTIMLIPQSLAYAMLAGLPPEVGLYASILPLVAYAIFGTSKTLAVGPVAVVSLMTASAVGQIAAEGTADYATAAVMLAGLSGLMLTAMGLLRLGFLANFLSHPVISGFITAAGLLIAVGQIKHLLGVPGGGEHFFDTLATLVRQIGVINPATLAMGAGALAALYWARKGLVGLLLRRGLPKSAAQMIAKAAPILVVAVTSLLTWGFDLAGRGLRIVGEVPAGLPLPALPSLNPGLIEALWMPALLISVVGFVESVSVAQTLAAKRRERIEPDQELIGLGAANLASGLAAGFPVTGGLARSVVNFEAGARTPAAGVFTAIGIALAAMFLTPALYYLPQAVLAATISLAVLTLVDFGSIRRSFRYSRPDFAAQMATILVTLGWGVEAGLIAGVSLSIGLYLWRSSRPHMAIVGQVPGTEHYRNIDRHEVLTCEDILSIRVDESLYFANARALEDRISAEVAVRPALRHVVLMASAINEIDASALDSLLSINARLHEAGITFHLSEVKGPVMDRLQRSDFLSRLTGEVHLSQHGACCAIRSDCAPRVGATRKV
ncbi:SulP family inorganic anion transporter [Falsigemmobacter intermedius]|uniref:Sulfate permease n=1 Tax=Falsigemmobacter intermedius TaxID=1553448 RepID=A0A3S3U3D0_9RHOB|nr:sulfate permease [Falsigemmobacter intermedius]RWY36410.1 sulfate permease [Falsigemmobacter intermedius]